MFPPYHAPPGVIVDKFTSAIGVPTLSTRSPAPREVSESSADESHDYPTRVELFLPNLTGLRWTDHPRPTLEYPRCISRLQKAMLCYPGWLRVRK